MGVPEEATARILGFGPLMGMLRCMSNCLGDAAVSCIVARRAGMLDMAA